MTLNKRIFFLSLFIASSTLAVEMEKDPTTALEVKPTLVTDVKKSGVKMDIAVPGGMHLNQDGPYSVETTGFEGEGAKKKFSKEVFDFKTKSAFVAGKKVSDSSPASAKVVLFVCNDQNTWCRRVVRNVSF